MKMLNWVPEVQNLSTILSDRDAPADEVGYAGLRLLVAMTCFKPMNGDEKWLTIPFAP